MNTAYLNKLYALRTRMRSFNVMMRFYVVGIIFFLGLIILFCMKSFGLFEDVRLEKFFILISLISITISFIGEALQLLLKMWSNSAGKVTIGIFLSCLVQLTRMVARLQINGITGLTPEYFGATLNYITIIISPLVILTATLIAVSIYFMVLYIIVLVKNILG